MTLDTIFNKIKQDARTIKVASKDYIVKDTEEDSPVGIDSLVQASKKLLAINRGQTSTDDRDSLRFKRIYNTDDLIRERIDLDAGKIKNALMFNLAKTKSLKYFKPGYFDSYASGHIVGNSLSAPSEEINPIQVLEQAYRVTQLGEGGIGSDRAITADAQNVHPSIFGFIDPSETPESERAGVDSRLVPSVRLGKDGNPYIRLREKKTGKLVWLTPDEIGDAIVAFPKD
jgi:DNA-directed RNA polymerase beta subunit